MDNRSSKGKRIVFDGLDLAGKTTQIFNLIDYLTRHKISVFAIAEQNGDTTNKYFKHLTPLVQGELLGNPNYVNYLNLSPKIRDIIINEYTSAPQTATALLFYTIRTWTVPLFKDLLNQGIWIILDRSIYSTYVYQGSTTEKPELFNSLENEVSLANSIDLSLIFTVSKQKYLERLQLTKRNILFDAWVHKYNEFSTKFLNLKNIYPTHNINFINSDKDVNSIFEQIIQIINKNLF